MMTSPRVLEGGVASDVVIVQEDGREIVIKQALPKLRVAADWHSDPERSATEVQALRTAAELLGAEVVPKVLWVDAPNHRFAMERVDPRLRSWRSRLEEGTLDNRTAVRAATLLAELHVRSAGRSDLAAPFANRVFFEQLRIQPFFQRSAERNPEISGALKAVIARLRAPGTALVHGDYSPKNILAREARVAIIDWEVAHWGDPRFDCAFCLSHLLLGGWRLSTSTRQFRELALSFAETYVIAGPRGCDDAQLVMLLGALLLARIDGDFPVDYLRDLDVPQAKSAALDLLRRPANSVREALESLSE